LLLQALTIARKILLFLTFSQRLVLSFFRLSDIATIAYELSVRISTTLSFGAIKTAIRYTASSTQVDENHFYLYDYILYYSVRLFVLYYILFFAMYPHFEETYLCIL